MPIGRLIGDKTFCDVSVWQQTNAESDNVDRLAEHAADRSANGLDGVYGIKGTDGISAKRGGQIHQADGRCVDRRSFHIGPGDPSTVGSETGRCGMVVWIGAECSTPIWGPQHVP